MSLYPVIDGSVALAAPAGTTSPLALPPGSVGFDPLVSLLITLGMSLLPALMFLGLWHGLMYLRDDDLVEEARRLEAQRATHDTASPKAKRGISSDRFDTPAADAVVVCEECHTRNVAGMDYCWNCLERLPKS